MKQGTIRVLACGFLAMLASGCATKTVEVRTRPPGADVFLNGTFIGKSPAKCQVRDYYMESQWFLKSDFLFEAKKEGYRKARVLYTDRPGIGVDYVPDQFYLILRKEKKKKE